MRMPQDVNGCLDGGFQARLAQFWRKPLGQHVSPCRIQPRRGDGEHALLSRFQRRVIAGQTADLSAALAFVPTVLTHLGALAETLGKLCKSHGAFELHSKTTRRAAFLAETKRVVPRGAVVRGDRAIHPKGQGGRPTVGLERMLRIHFLQQWFNLSDPATEESLYDSVAMRRFVGIDLGREAAPDESTILRFRHLLETHHVGRKLFEPVHRQPGSTRPEGFHRHHRGRYHH